MSHAPNCSGSETGTLFPHGRPSRASETPPACRLAPGACSPVLFKWPPPASLLRLAEGFPGSRSLCGLPSSCFLSLFLFWTLDQTEVFLMKPLAQPCSRSIRQADRQRTPPSAVPPEMGGECGPHPGPAWLLGHMVILFLPDM